MRPNSEIDRRKFLGAVAATTVASAVGPRIVFADTEPVVKTTESLVAEFYRGLSEQQRQAICFDWNHRDPQRGLLRTFVANNWNIVPQEIISDFYTDDQRDLIKVIFESMIQPDWHERYYQQLEDDAGGFGHEQSVAIFGTPGK
jgi:hypothetical protein